ncbi:ankyrin repeat protein [Acanthamoeba polyphaga moumouvirus]|uniref:Ankyrin repeat protein n=1 Tax=Acanthamoeba polyphaga moumouvirus TaxID=1269028 RepID=L7RC32_9VIRU|nr:ankyrin repeat protein [Acanthamoeba polyphaga moumouvirus]AGC02074.1 ankyrin repeat protein [Acanthamoeba polyphaga moumouvirus]
MSFNTNLIDLCNSGNLQEIHDFFSRENISDDQIKHCIRNLSCKIEKKFCREISDILRSFLKNNISDGEYIKLVEPYKLYELCSQGSYCELKNYFDTYEITSEDLFNCFMRLINRKICDPLMIELILYHPNWNLDEYPYLQIIYHALIISNNKLLKYLFNAKSDIKITHKIIKCCFHFKNYEIIKFLLLEKISNPTEFINQHEIILECAISNDKRFVDLFIDLGVDFNNIIAIFFAINTDNDYFVQKYIELGYRFDPKYDDPIIFSINSKSANVLDVLLKNEISYDLEKIQKLVDKMQPNDNNNQNILNVLKNYGIID